MHEETRKTIDEAQTNAVVRKYVETMQMKKYRPNTINSYLPYFKHFAEKYEAEILESMPYSQIAWYIDNELRKGIEGEGKKHLICAIKFYYEYVLGREKYRTMKSGSFCTNWAKTQKYQ